MADQQQQKKPYEFTEGKVLAKFERRNAKSITEVRVVEVTMTTNGRTKPYVKIGQRAIEDKKPGFEKSVTIEAGLFEGILGAMQGLVYKAPKDTTVDDEPQVATKRTSVDEAQLAKLAAAAKPARKTRSDSTKAKNEATLKEAGRRKSSGARK